jgi:hypothetical protein
MKIIKVKVNSIFRFTFYLLPLILLLATSCIVDKNRFEVPTPTPEPRKESTLKDDLKVIENANFKYVYVFKKKDGEKFNSEDIDYLKFYANPNTNQWLKSDGGITVIAGSNYIFDKKMLDALQKRFIVEGLSPKEAESEQNTKVNR